MDDSNFVVHFLLHHISLLSILNMIGTKDPIGRDLESHLGVNHSLYFNHFLKHISSHSVLFSRKAGGSNGLVYG